MTTELFQPFQPLAADAPALARVLQAATTLLVKKDSTGEALYAARSYRPGDVVLAFEQVERRSQRDRFTVQDPSGQHLFHPVLAKTAHSCDPNCRIDLAQRVLVALRPIQDGETITYDYESTESWFSHPFWCLCGSRRCRGRIG